MNDFDIQIRYRKKTRRATLRVLPGKVIRVTAPYRLPEREIKEFVLKNTDWILKRYKIIEATPLPTKFEFKDGEIFRFLGNEYALKTTTEAGEVAIHNNYLVVPVPVRVVDKARYTERKLIQWYKMQAMNYLQLRVAHFTQLIGAKEKSISLKSYKSRWGCCSSKGDLIFNWQIISFKSELIDYVVAHEVCHLKEMNHSVRFYKWLSHLGFEKRKYHSLMRSAQNLFT